MQCSMLTIRYYIYKEKAKRSKYKVCKYTTTYKTYVNVYRKTIKRKIKNQKGNKVYLLI